MNDDGEYCHKKFQAQTSKIECKHCLTKKCKNNIKFNIESEIITFENQKFFKNKIWYLLRHSTKFHVLKQKTQWVYCLTNYNQNRGKKKFFLKNFFFVDTPLRVGGVFGFSFKFSWKVWEHLKILFRGITKSS